MKLVLLYGPPAVGKLSVAEALAVATGFRVLHNHLLINLSLALFGWGARSRDFSRQLRETSLHAAREAGVPGIILTAVYSRDRDDYYLGLCERAEAEGDSVCLVRLRCSVETLEARVTEPTRQAFDKLTTVAGLQEKLAGLEEPFGLVSGRDSLTLETDKTMPAQIAADIVRHFRLA